MYKKTRTKCITKQGRSEFILSVHYCYIQKCRLARCAVIHPLTWFEHQCEGGVSEREPVVALFMWPITPQSSKSRSVLQWWRQSKCALLRLVVKLSKQRALLHPSLWESPDSRLVSQWVQKTRYKWYKKNQRRGKTRTKCVLSPSHYFLFFKIFPQCDWIEKVNP